MAEILVVGRQDDVARYDDLLTDHALTHCQTPDRAIQVATSRETPFALAVVLWELSGAQVLIRLQQVSSTTPVIVVTEVGGLIPASRAKELGAVDFIARLSERERLPQAAAKALGPQAVPPLLLQLQARLIGESTALRDTLASLARVIPKHSEPVLLVGESGTGKELLARAVHDLGGTKDAWVAVNVASLKPELVESDLFGHEPGAFTGANAKHTGFFEECGCGTLFLDEIGELSPAIQSTLLRVLQEGTFRRLKGTVDLRFEGRLVCATNRDLLADIRKERFREDLYHRINTHEIRIPPLRERMEDLDLLLEHLLRRHAAHPDTRLAPETQTLLAEYAWPGNVRELENIVRHCLTECLDGEILPFHLPVTLMNERRETTGPDSTDYDWREEWLDFPQQEAMKRVEREFNRTYLPRLYERHGRQVTTAARAAGIDPKTFRSKWKDAGLPPLPGK